MRAPGHCVANVRLFLLLLAPISLSPAPFFSSLFAFFFFDTTSHCAARARWTSHMFSSKWLSSIVDPSFLLRLLRPFFFFLFFFYPVFFFFFSFLPLLCAFCRRCTPPSPVSCSTSPRDVTTSLGSGKQYGAARTCTCPG